MSACRRIESKISFRREVSDRKWSILLNRRTVEIVLAVVLFAAVGLKAHQLFYSGPSIPDIFHNNTILAGIIQMEILLGLWLVIGGQTYIRFVAAIICFSLFAAVAVYEALHTLPSCGCFGNVKVPPAITAGFDISAVTVLWLTRPRDNFAENPALSGRRCVIGIIMAITTAVVLWTVFVLNLRENKSVAAFASTA